MPSPLAHSDESMPYGCTRRVLKAANAALAKRDPKKQRARSKASSGGRREENVLRTMPMRDLLKEFLRRESLKQQRLDAGERKVRWRLRQRRKKAAEAAN